MISSAFFPAHRLRTPEPTFLPLSGTLSDFRRVLTEPSFFDASRVSLAVTGSTVVGAILFGIPRNADDEPLPIPGPGALLLSSDGLWNYAPGEREIAELFGRMEGDAIAICRGLVEFAKERGGEDNITVAVLRFGEENGERVQG